MRLQVLAALLTCLFVPTLSAQVVITEFMARNASTLEDEDRESSDWIEIRNAGTQVTNLAGWTLTDDPLIPNKWTFPAVMLAPGEHLIIFASSKDRAVLGQELHTNFKLTGTGDYLALINPQGVPTTQFAPQYPPQHVDVSYGLEGTSSTLVAEGAACETFVPANGTLGNTWQQGSVAGWLQGKTGVGYERGTGYQNIIALDVETQMYGRNSSIYIRVPFNVNNPAAFQGMKLRMKYDDGFVAYLNGVRLADGNVPGTVLWSSAAPSTRSDTEAVIYEDHDITSQLSALKSGTNILAIQGLNYSSTNVDFLIIPELTAGSYLTATGYLPNPSPNGVNGSLVQGFVGDVTASADRGIYDQPFAVTLSCLTPGATIRYTLDGSQPTLTNSSIYQSSVNVTGSTTLRARAFITGWGPSKTTTKTFVFPSDVFTQPASIPGLPNTWGGTGSGGTTITADYAMDPAVTQNPAYASRLRGALESHPVVCLSMDPKDLFDPAIGIYISPDTDPAIPRESATSVEYFEPQGNGAFQIDCGARISGNGSTRRWSSKKLSVRLLFKNQYGAGRLDYPMFEAPAVTNFNTLTLDAYYAFTWNYAPYYASQSTRMYRWSSTQYTRDTYASQLHSRMGAKATSGKYVNLLINGVYWGLYNIHERPDEEFMTSYHGGAPEDWDIIRHNQNNVQSGSNTGWLQLMNMVNSSSIATPAGYAAVKQILDVENLADYMIMNLFLGFSTDWPGSNWYSATNRVDPNIKWRMISWDAEHILKDLNQNSTNYSNNGSPARLYSRLRLNPEFRVMFGDRLHRAFFNGGPLYVNATNPAWNPLTPENNRPAELYSKIADSIEEAVILESARWGNAFTTGTSYTLAHWTTERDRLLNSYFPRRSAIVLQQFRSGNLYPNLAAPQFGQHGGTIPAGYKVSMTGPAGSAIWYTTDGSDPRLSGGTISPTAVSYSSPVTLLATANVKARALSQGSWSALNEASFLVETITINEILAKNVAGIVDSAGEHEDWIELHNQSSQAVVVSGMYLTDDPAIPTKWKIPAGYTMNPGATLLLWADNDLLQGPLHTSFKLSASGEDLRLYDKDGVTLLSKVKFGVQLPDISTGWMRDGSSDLLVSFLDPSPRAANEIAVCGTRRYSAQDASTQPTDLQLSGIPGLGKSVTFNMQGAQANAPHLLAIGTVPGEVSLAASTSPLMIGQGLGLFASLSSGASGSAALNFTIPPIPGLVGLSLYFQDWTVLNSSLVASNGLELKFCK